MVDDCTFCKIIHGEYSCMKVFEDEDTLAFMDAAKDVDGHILVVPKKHVKNLLDCDEDTLSRVMSTIRKVSKHLVRDCGYDGINLLNANEESAGQSVPHFHIHIIPRKKQDGIDAWPQFGGAKAEIEEIHRSVTMLRPR